MKIEMVPPHTVIPERPYCCVPAVLQMILKRRGLQYPSQEEIGLEKLSIVLASRRISKQIGLWIVSVSSDDDLDVAERNKIKTARGKKSLPNRAFERDPT